MLVQRGSRHDAETGRHFVVDGIRGDQADSPGDGLGCARVVTSHHDRLDAGFPYAPHSFLNAGFRRVLQGDEPTEFEILQGKVRIFRSRASELKVRRNVLQPLLCEAEHTLALPHQRLESRVHLGPGIEVHVAHVEDALGRSLEDGKHGRLGRALRREGLRRRHGVHCEHPLIRAVKRNLENLRVLAPNVFDAPPEGGAAPLDDSHFCGRAGVTTLSVVLGRGVQRSTAREARELLGGLGREVGPQPQRLEASACGRYDEIRGRH
mmetsp:Transcript_40803/g.112213  ORF Transcript_40803/g.112213 Transcript_40803/m.112213 type:complete len:265 (-) Transcript_40803:1115-1909(-)